MHSLLLSLSTVAALSVSASPVAINGALQARQNSASPLVSIKNGTLSGRYEPSLSQDLFLNVPYAQAPTGDLRLADPQPYNGTFNNSTRDATQWGKICPGSGISSTPNVTLGQNYSLDEDCLNINIIRPSGVKKGDNLPVLFWIYGGGFVQGTANDPRYNGSYLVQRSVENGEPVVFASINYRLSAFGFPANPDNPLNLGLKDQRLALRWLQENIAEFGADPKKVTIWGQSAGGSSVAAQMIAYGGRDEGLFRSACIDSGIFAGSNASLASQAPAWSRFLNATGCDTDDQELSCLRALPYETFYNATISSNYNPSPVPDGDFMRENTLVSFANQRVVAVPFLIGATKDEATSGIGAPVGLNNDTAVRTAVTTRFATISASNETIDTLLELYPDDNELGCPFDTGDGVVSTGLQDKRTNAIWTDQLHAGARKAAQAMSKVKVFSWRFNQVPQNNTIDAGAAHANELPYIFGVQNRTIRTPLGNRPGDLALSATMQNYWLNFVNHLDPNGKNSSKNATKWESYDEDGKNMVFLNKGSKMVEDDYREEGIEFLIKMGLGEI